MCCIRIEIVLKILSSQRECQCDIPRHLHFDRSTSIKNPRDIRLRGHLSFRGNPRHDQPRSQTRNQLPSLLASVSDHTTLTNPSLVPNAQLLPGCHMQSPPKLAVTSYSSEQFSHIAYLDRILLKLTRMPQRRSFVTLSSLSSSPLSSSSSVSS